MAKVPFTKTKAGKTFIRRVKGITSSKPRAWWRQGKGGGGG